jgi:hypothetical protein
MVPNCFIEGEWQSLLIAAALQPRIRTDTIGPEKGAGGRDDPVGINIALESTASRLPTASCWFSTWGMEAEELVRLTSHPRRHPITFRFT